jgi:hypothetical protein
MCRYAHLHLERAIQQRVREEHTVKGELTSPAMSLDMIESTKVFSTATTLIELLGSGLIMRVAVGRTADMVAERCHWAGRIPGLRQHGGLL